MARSLGSGQMSEEFDKEPRFARHSEPSLSLEELRPPLSPLPQSASGATPSTHFTPKFPLDVEGRAGTGRKSSDPHFQLDASPSDDHSPGVGRNPRLSVSLSSLPLSWTIRWGDLTIGEPLDKGQFGSVCKGTFFGAEVAIKKVRTDSAFFPGGDEEGQEYLEREIKLLTYTRHPCIVQFIGACYNPHDKAQYLVFEYMPDGNLKRWLPPESGPRLSWVTKLRVAKDVASTMTYLHQENILHRDLKSENILIEVRSRGLRAKLCDFGMARPKEKRKRSKTVRSMTICGTEPYVSPEVVSGLPYDEKCDVFSFGICLAEIIFERRPGTDFLIRVPQRGFEVDVEELRKLEAEEGVPTGFVDIALQCLQYEPNDRPFFPAILQSLITLWNSLSAAPLDMGTLVTTATSTDAATSISPIPPSAAAAAAAAPLPPPHPITPTSSVAAVGRMASTSSIPSSSSSKPILVPATGGDVPFLGGRTDSRASDHIWPATPCSGPDLVSFVTEGNQQRQVFFPSGDHTPVSATGKEAQAQRDLTLTLSQLSVDPDHE